MAKLRHCANFSQATQPVSKFRRRRVPTSSVITDFRAVMRRKQSSLYRTVAMVRTGSSVSARAFCEATLNVERVGVSDRPGSDIACRDWVPTKRPFRINKERVRPEFLIRGNPRYRRWAADRIHCLNMMFRRPPTCPTYPWFRLLLLRGSDLLDLLDQGTDVVGELRGRLCGHQHCDSARLCTERKTYPLCDGEISSALESAAARSCGRAFTEPPHAR
jgi:hypothetical protein